MKISQTANSLPETEWRRNMIERVFKQFDEDSDGKLTALELIRCLSSCYGIHVDDDDLEKFLQEDGKIQISGILQALDCDGVNFFRSLREMDSFDLCLPLLGMIFKDMQSKAFNLVKPEKDQVVIDINQLNVSLPPISDEYSNISKLREMFLGLTGQAAISFVAYAPTRPLHIIVPANALAFLLLLISFWLRGKKPVKAERMIATIGISTAVLVFFLMMGMISIPVKIK